MAAVAPHKYVPLYDQQRHVLAEVVHSAQLVSLQRVYYAGMRRIVAALLKAYEEREDEPPHRVRDDLISHLREELGSLAVELLDEIAARGYSAVTTAIGSTFEMVEALDREAEVDSPDLPEKQRLAIDRRERARVTGSMRSFVQTALARFMVSVNSELRQRIRIALREEKPLPALRRIERKALDRWGGVETIARTAIAWIYNAARAHVLKALSSVDEEDALWLRWTELVDDRTGKPKDALVGEDSIVLHGQVTLPGGVFTMPADDRVHPSMWHRSWAHPPNRDNDRAVIVPWRKSWEIPAWRYVGGRRVLMGAKEST